MADHLNTVRDIARYDSQVDRTAVVNHLIYDAFGNVTAESHPAVESLFLVTGTPFDSDTGLQNNLSRWYDPIVGRWLSEDRIGFAGGDGNFYRYVRNRPKERGSCGHEVCRSDLCPMLRRVSEVYDSCGTHESELLRCWDRLAPCWRRQLYCALHLAWLVWFTFGGLRRLPTRGLRHHGPKVDGLRRTIPGQRDEIW